MASDDHVRLAALEAAVRERFGLIPVFTKGKYGGYHPDCGGKIDFVKPYGRAMRGQ